MSDIERFEGMGGEVPECVGLYDDMRVLHRQFGAELQDYVGGPDNTAAAEIIAEEDIAYELLGGAVELRPDFAETGAQALDPQEFSTPRGAFYLSGMLLDEAGVNVELPRKLESPGTQDPGGLSTIIVPPEGQPYVVNALDLDAAHEIVTGQLALEPTMDITSYAELLRERGEAVEHVLSEEDCRVLRHSLGQLRHHVETTARENEIPF